ncbi:MAG: TrkA family potassium uptake protein [Actinobacteria bacterium]|nr:TrkA family potassium uptake protein [Actinomycetota bacterium]MCL5882533.1 TrkA family potassium uptake protein [Actinomycetota bacterium]
MKIVVLGCGRVGSQLAGALYVEGHDVSIIDKDPKAFRRLNPSFQGKIVTGVGFDRDVLIDAGIERADGFASVTNGDNSNIISALIAKRVFRVPRVVTRIYDPMRANIYKRFGIPTISSTVWGANGLREHLLYREMRSELSFGSGEVLLLEFEVPVGLVGRSVADLTVEGQALITCVVRLGQAMVPSGATVFREGDLIFACVANGFLGKFRELLGY